jgi:hypothetical protein
LTTLAILTFSSCVVTENLSIQQNGSGSSTADIGVQDFFISVLKDFSDLSSQTDAHTTVMDASMHNLSSALEKGKTTSNVKFTKTDNNNYVGNFDFAQLNALITDLGGDKDQTLLTLDGTTLKFYLDINNYNQLVKVIPFLSDPNFETFGPAYNQGMSEKDYLDMISFMLGDEGPDAIRNSTITINIKAPAPITFCSGGTKVDATTFRFQFPLIDFLLLNKPMQFSLSW